MRILQIVGEIDGGGVAAVVYNYLSHMNLTGIECDILAFEKKEYPHQILEKPFSDLGCHVIYFKHRNTGYRDHFSRYADLLSERKYDAVHCHFGIWATPYLYLAKKAGVPVRISHAHSSHDEYEGLKQTVLNLSKPFLNSVVTHRVACGRVAGEYLWGRHPFMILNNAVDTSRFHYNEESRVAHRNEFSVLDSEFLIGHVGRFSYEKNQLFLVEVMKEVHRNRNDIKLLFVGRGDDLEAVQSKVKEYGLESCVLFAGVRSDVNELVQAMDLLVLPSLFEGMPVVTVEAQCSGLPVIISDKVPSEAILSDTAQQITIDNGVEPWVTAILSSAKNDFEKRNGAAESIAEKGMDISREAEKLRKVYLEAIK